MTGAAVVVSHLQGMLCYDPMRRMSAYEACKHAYFSELEEPPVSPPQVMSPATDSCQTPLTNTSVESTDEEKS